MTSWTFNTDSVYITNQTGVTSGDSSVNDTGSDVYVVRVNVETLKWVSERPLITINIPELTDKEFAKTYMIDLGQATERIEINGFLTTTSEDSAKTKELNLFRLAYIKNKNQGLALVRKLDSTTTRVWSDDEYGDTGVNRVWAPFFIKKIEITDDAKDQYTTDHNGNKAVKKKVNIIGICGEAKA